MFVSSDLKLSEGNLSHSRLSQLNTKMGLAQAKPRTDE